jgi:ABC-type nitrate/sulfonate/bicarbonate transport system permease component
LRALIGLVVAATLGVALAILSDLSPVLSRGIRYVSDVLQPIPPAAFVPMAVFMLGLGAKLHAFVIVLVTVWPTYLNGVAALQSVSPVQVNTGLTRSQLLWQIRLPAAKPEIFTGIRHAAAISLTAVIVAEMLAGRDGIGFMIYKKANGLRTPEVFGLMFLVAFSGVALNLLVAVLRRSMTAWHMGMMERPE